MVLHWSTSLFQALYDAIARDDTDVKQDLIAELIEDLTSLSVKKEKSEASRKILESGEIKFADGSAFKINKNFIDNAIQLADHLNLDEIIAAEILYFATSNEQSQLGTSYVESAIAAYFNRSILILQIVSYCLCHDVNIASDKSKDEKMSDILSVYNTEKNMIISAIFKHDNYFSTRIMKSLEGLEKDLDSLKEQVDRSRLLGTFHSNSKELKLINYKRNMIFKEYQLLGEVVFGFTLSVGNDSNKFGSKEFIHILDHLSSFNPQDVFSLCYIPALFSYVSKIETYSDETVEALHRGAMEKINNIDKLSESPMNALILFAFLTYFINWCKADPLRTKKYEFSSTVEIPMHKCIQAGSLEQLLSICADTSVVELNLTVVEKPFYDFRSFLQQHIPKLIPVKLLDMEKIESNNLNNSFEQQMQIRSEKSNDSNDLEYIINENFIIDQHTINFIIPVVSDFFHAFISSAAFIMTQLRDTEEDLLISSETFDLEILTENADLERFYMAIYYLHYGRENITSEIWSDVNTPFYGFLQWASKCNSPLITSTFAMLLSGLSSGEENAISVFSFLQSTNLNASLSVNSKHNSTLLTKYPSISWSTIYSTLNYYCEALVNATESTLQSLTNVPLDVEMRSKKRVVTELGEDSIIYISGFFQVLSEVARNSSKARKELLESDNGQLLTILSKLLNMNTMLNGSILTLLGSLAGDDMNERNKFWNILDSWVFVNNRNASPVNFPKELISKKMIDYQHVSGLVDILTKLLSDVNSKSDLFEPLALSFPLDIGSTVRRPGVWCYLDYLCTDVISHLEYTELSSHNKLFLKYRILNLLESCVCQLDPELVFNSSICGVKDLDAVVVNKNFIKYLQAHPGSAVLTSLFKSNVLESLFATCMVDIEQIYGSQANSPQLLMIEKCLNLFNKLVDYEKFYSDELVPILRLPDNTFMDPNSISVTGPHSFSQSMLLNLPVLANITLFVGSDKLNISSISLRLLSKIYTSKEFSNVQHISHTNLIKKNRFLLLCETIDESVRIRSAFIHQFNSYIINKESLSMKLSLLQFISDNLEITDEVPSASHFLLGFDTIKMDFGRADIVTTIASKNSLLNSIILTLKDTLPLLDAKSNLEYAQVRLCALSMEILAKLCKSNLTSNLVLKHLREIKSESKPIRGTNFIFELTRYLSFIDSSTYLNGSLFDREINIESKFCQSGGLDTLSAMVSLKSSCLQLITIDLHTAVILGELLLVKEYQKSLVELKDPYVGSSTLVSLLDALNFKVINSIEKPNSIFNGVKFDYIFKKVGSSAKFGFQDSFGPYDTEIIDKVVSLVAKSDGANAIKTNCEFLNAEKYRLKTIIKYSIMFDRFKYNMLNYVTSWNILVQIVINGFEMTTDRKIDLTCNILQSLVPILDEYLELDIAFVEPLVSLCVGLFTSRPGEESGALIRISNRLFPAFRVFWNGIAKSSSSSQLRSEFYVLARSFMEGVANNKELLTEMGIFIASSDRKIFDIIRNDATLGENANRITSLMLLESFVKLFAESRYLHDGFVFQCLCDENFLQSIVRQIQRFDVLFLAEFQIDIDNDVERDDMMYEFTCFKTNISLLTRVAQTRIGAQLLLSGGIFTTIKECRFLSVDNELRFLIKSQDSTKTIERVKMETSSFKQCYLDYDLFVSIFRLLTTLIICLGPQNQICSTQAAEIVHHFHDLIKLVMQEDIKFQKMVTDSMNYTEEDFARGKQLQELSKLLTLLYSLV